jgi:hypothetical protein
MQMGVNKAGANNGLGKLIVNDNLFALHPRRHVFRLAYFQDHAIPDQNSSGPWHGGIHGNYGTGLKQGQHGGLP